MENKMLLNYNHCSWKIKFFCQALREKKHKMPYKKVCKNGN